MNTHDQTVGTPEAQEALGRIRAQYTAAELAEIDAVFARLACWGLYLRPWTGAAMQWTTNLTQAGLVDYAERIDPADHPDDPVNHPALNRAD